MAASLARSQLTFGVGPTTRMRVVEPRVQVADPFAASRAALLHRHHVLHELVDGDLGALVEARLFVLLEGRLIPV